MGEPPGELHSAIISSDVTLKSGAARDVRGAHARGVCGVFDAALKRSGNVGGQTCERRDQRHTREMERREMARDAPRESGIS
jgi:hypothetical protein